MRARLIPVEMGLSKLSDCSSLLGLPSQSLLLLVVVEDRGIIL